MLDYTKAAVKQTIDDFKKMDYIRNVVTQVLYIAYLAYAIFSGSGFFVLYGGVYFKFSLTRARYCFIASESRFLTISCNCDNFSCICSNWCGVLGLKRISLNR